MRTESRQRNRDSTTRSCLDRSKAPLFVSPAAIDAEVKVQMQKGWNILSFAVTLSCSFQQALVPPLDQKPEHALISLRRHSTCGRL